MQEIGAVFVVSLTAVVLSCLLPCGGSVLHDMERTNQENEWEIAKQLLITEADNVRQRNPQ